MKRCLFPGSFDPFTKGHEAVIAKSLSLFDEIIIGVGVNSTKQYMFTLEKRIAHIESLFEGKTNVRVGHFQTLTVNYCKEIGAQYLLRGIRSASDFEYEKTIAHLNHTMESEIETILMLSPPEYSSISSTIVREIIIGKGDVSKFVPIEIVNGLSCHKV